MNEVVTYCKAKLCLTKLTYNVIRNTQEFGKDQ